MRQLLPIFVLATPVVGRCGPTAEDAGRSVMVAAPCAFVVGIGILMLLLRLWRRGRHKDLRLRQRPLIQTTLVLVGGAGVALLSAIWSPWAMKWIGIALLASGTSYLTLMLVTWRIWFAVKPADSFRWAPLAALLVYWLPALVAAAGLISDAAASKHLGAVWVLPGYFGMVTGPLVLGLLLEAYFRGRRATRASFRS